MSTGRDKPLRVSDLSGRLSLRTEEVAWVLGISVRRVRELRPYLAHFHIGNSIRFSVAGVREFMARRIKEARELEDDSNGRIASTVEQHLKKVGG